MTTNGRGQGAMEYMMTYGWAILAVMVVGVAMWRLGVFDLGGSTPPTSSGFDTLKPLLSTCEIGSKGMIVPGSAAGVYPGLTCQFTNNAGAPILVKDISINISGQPCALNYVEKKPFSAGPGCRLYHTCTINSGAGGCVCNPSSGNTVYNWDGSCTNMPPSSSCSITATGCGVTIDTGAQFTIATMSYTYSCGPCPGISKGTPYDAYIEMTYDVSIGGVTETKRNAGTIHAVATT
jgi:hypothetical protein